MQPDVHFFLLGQFLRLALRPHVEADDDGVRRRSQQHIRLCNCANSRTQNFQPNFFVRQFREQVAQHFHRSLHIALQDDVQFLGAGSLDLLCQPFERNAGTLRQHRLARFLFAIFRNAARFVAIRNHHKLIASLRQTFHAQNFHRRRRRSFLQHGPAIVKHGANFAVDVAHHKVIAGSQRAVLHQHCGHRSAAAVELGFEHHTSSGALRRSFELAQVGDQGNHFHQQVQIGFLFRRHIYEHRLATPIFRHQPAIGELLFHAVRQSLRLIDFVHRHDDGNFRGVRVVNRLQCLRHHAVIGRNH